MWYYFAFMCGLFIGFLVCAMLATGKKADDDQRTLGLIDENKRLRRALEDFKR
jgi:hypothetical protein